MGLATFLLGDATNLVRYVSSSTNAKESQKRMFTYVEDTWRITPKLTLNAGLRWEMYFPETLNGKGQGGFADLNTGLINVAGYGPYNTAINVDNNWKLIAPRVGIAYQLNQKTVIRAGYGRDYDIGVFGTIFGHVQTQNLPVLANQNLTKPVRILPRSTSRRGQLPSYSPRFRQAARFPSRTETMSRSATIPTSFLRWMPGTSRFSVNLPGHLL